VIAVPASVVPETLEQCGQKGIGGAVVISAGFKETGNAELERSIVEIADKHGIALIGPNCLGVINTHSGINLDASFAPLLPQEGEIGFASQSGALCSGIINLLPTLNVGLAQLISLGNQGQTGAAEIISYWGNQRDVKQILLYLETISDGEAFKTAATAAAKTKPIIALKSGRSDVGAKAAASHTGSMAGADKYAEAIFESCGVIRENNLKDAFNTAQAFSKCALPKGKNVCVVTNSGGPGILAADRLSELGLRVVSLGENTKNSLRAFLAPQASVNNPVDVIASASREQYYNAMDTVLGDPDVDMMLLIYLYITGRNDVNIVRDLNQLKDKHKKPICAVFMTADDFPALMRRDRLVPAIPIYNFPEEAALSLKRLYDYAKRAAFDKSRDPLALDIKSAMQKSRTCKYNTAAAQKIIDTCKQQNRKLSTFESLEIFKCFKLPLVPYSLITNESQVTKTCNQIGYPLVLKISHPNLSHKTDIGGVILNIKTPEQALESYKKIIASIESAGELDGLEGIVAMKQVTGKREFIIGTSHDPALGKFMMFGLGGIFTEAFKEVKFTPLPLTAWGASKLLDGKVAKFLEPLRGDSAVNTRALFGVFFNICALMTALPKVTELDVNPLMADKDGNVFAVDARIGLE
jgi:acetyltransferase